jgi:hypothetical protein
MCVKKNLNALTAQELLTGAAYPARGATAPAESRELPEHQFEAYTTSSIVTPHVRFENDAHATFPAIAVVARGGRRSLV